jgi:O-antigen/teichoic acid export membrane protein
MTEDKPESSISGARLVSPRRMAGVSLISLVYFGFQSLLFLVLTPWLFRVLGDEVYGLWSILVAITAFASLGDFGTSLAVVKYVAQFSTLDESRDDLSATILFSFIFLLLVGLLAGLILFGLRGWIISQVALSEVSSVQLASALTMIAVGLTPFFLSQLPKGILIGLVRSELAGGITTIQQTALLVGALVIGLCKGSIVELASWNLLVQAVFGLLAAYLAWRVLRPFHLRLVWNKQVVPEIAVYSLVSWIANLGSMLFGSADRLLVGMLLGPSAAGVYAIVTGAAMRLNRLLAPITDVLMPFASSYQAAGKSARVQFAFKYGSRFAACLLVAIASALVLWSEPILTVWISQEFSNQYSSLFRVLVVCYAVFSMNAPAYQMSRGLGFLIMPAVITIGAGFATLGCIAALAPNLGLTGVAVANFAYTATLGINLYVAKKLRLKWIAAVFKPLGPPLLVLLASVVVTQTSSPSTLVALVITSIILVLLLWMILWGEDGRKLLKAVAARTTTSSC